MTVLDFRIALLISEKTHFLRKHLELGENLLKQKTRINFFPVTFHDICKSRRREGF